MGYFVSEESLEYSGNGDLVKKKVTKKYFPPDATALKLYKEFNNTNNKNIDELAIKELENLKQKYLLELNEFLNKGDKK